MSATHVERRAEGEKHHNPTLGRPPTASRRLHRTEVRFSISGPRRPFLAFVSPQIRSKTDHPRDRCTCATPWKETLVPLGTLYSRCLIPLSENVSFMATPPGFYGEFIMHKMVVVGASGAMILAALMLSTTSGQTQTQTNTQTAVQGQGQTQSTASSSTSYGTSASLSGADASNASLNAGSQNINFNYPATPSETKTKITNIPNVYAPGLAAAGSEVCLGSISAGGSGAGFGVTIGGTYVDRECQLRLNARTLAVLGYPVAARETMCLDPDVRQAMLAAGTPCAGDRYAYPPSGAYRRADVADPRNSNAAAPVQVEPAQIEPRQTVSAPESTSGPTPSATPGLQPGCRKEWRLFSGWYITCDGQGAAYQQTAETDPEQSEPPVQQAVRRKSAVAAKPAQTDQRKSVAASKPTQADQQKPTTAAKPAKSDPWKAMDPDADAVQAAQQKPTAAAKPAKSDPWKAVDPDTVQATQQKSSSAITQPTQTDPWKTASAAKSVQTDPAKVMAYAVPAADPAKATASAVPAADPAKAMASAVPAADPAKAMAVPAADPRKSKTKTSAAAKQKVSTSDSIPDQMSDEAPGCRNEYDIIGGWRKECN
jgi:hypothetical protein